MTSNCATINNIVLWQLYMYLIYESKETRALFCIKIYVKILITTLFKDHAKTDLIINGSTVTDELAKLHQYNTN